MSTCCLRSLTPLALLRIITAKPNCRIRQMFDGASATVPLLFCRIFLVIQSLYNMTWAVSRWARMKTATLTGLSELLTLTPVNAAHQTGADVSFSTDLALLHFAFLPFLLKHEIQGPLTPHGKSLATTKLWKSLPRAASDSVPRCLAALLRHPGLLHCRLWNSFCG